VKTKIGADFYSQFLENDFLPSQWNLNSGSLWPPMQTLVGLVTQSLPQDCVTARCTTKKSRGVSLRAGTSKPLLVLLVLGILSGMNPGNSRGKTPPQVLGVNGGGRC